MLSDAPECSAPILVLPATPNRLFYRQGMVWVKVPMVLRVTIDRESERD